MTILLALLAISAQPSLTPPPPAADEPRFGGLFIDWREANREVDFVVRAGRHVLGIEVKSCRAPTAFAGLGAFSAAFKPTRTVIAGGDGIPLAEFPAHPVEHWLRT